MIWQNTSRLVDELTSYMVSSTRQSARSSYYCNNVYVWKSHLLFITFINFTGAALTTIGWHFANLSLLLPSFHDMFSTFVFHAHEETNRGNWQTYVVVIRGYTIEQAVSSLLYETFCFIFLAGLHGTSWYILLTYISLKIPWVMQRCWHSLIRVKVVVWVVQNQCFALLKFIIRLFS